MAIDDDQGWAVRFFCECREGPFKHVEIIGITDSGDVPSITDESGGHVFAEGPLGVAFDRDLIVVVDPAEVGQFQVRR